MASSKIILSLFLAKAGLDLYIPTVAKSANPAPSAQNNVHSIKVRLRLTVKRNQCS
jgi:hypothetical protein